MVQVDSIYGQCKVALKIAVGNHLKIKCFESINSSKQYKMDFSRANVTQPGNPPTMTRPDDCGPKYPMPASGFQAQSLLSLVTLLPSKPPHHILLTLRIIGHHPKTLLQWLNGVLWHVFLVFQGKIPQRLALNSPEKRLR